MDTEELLKKLDADRDAYLATFQRLHEALARNIIQSSTASTASTPLNIPGTRAPLDRTSRLSKGESDRKAALTFRSGNTGDTDDLSDDDQALYVQDLLPRAEFDDEHLLAHMRRHEWNDESKKMLQPLFTPDGRLKFPRLFPSGSKALEDESRYSLYHLFNIGTDGAPLPLHAATTLRKLPKGQAMWEYLKAVNTDSSKLQVVGRIIILREPSPTLFAAVHLTMKELFDMDEIFCHLVQQGTTTAHMMEVFSEDRRKQRSFIFSFEYFTVIGEACEPMDWQQKDQERGRKDGHIPISRCSAVVALSLAGEPIKRLKNPARNPKTRYGYVYNPWAPWHVLNIQCYPDWKSNTESHDSTKHYVNGPEAFLNTLLVEFRDAQKRFDEISLRVSKLITPPADFMFNGDLRDNLLFEDKDFTYSRRYFWAFQTLGTMNQSIRAMIDAYEDTFTKDVWEGRHKSLWPLLEETSPRNEYWKKRMTSLKKDFEAEIAALRVIMEENEIRRREITDLRENLFSGTSVLESRKSVEQAGISVEQGHNIKLLTLVNMFFLPLTFVTSVFGMTNMPVDASFWRFGVTMATVCVPFFLLIGSMNTSRGMRFWKEQFGSVLVRLFNFFNPMKARKNGEKEDSDSENSTGMPHKHIRSLSASEGMAKRAQREISIDKKAEFDLNLSPGKQNSFGQILATKERASSGSTPVNASTTAVISDEIQPVADPTVSVSERPSLHPPPHVMTSRSYARSNAISESSETSDGPIPRAAQRPTQRNFLDLLWPSRPRRGGKEYSV